MKGIILAGGSGTRLYPVTQSICKQLLPVYDKPLIYYPLSVLMLAGIKEILFISTPNDLHHFKDLFKDGSHLGLRISYAEQQKPAGIAQAFMIGKSFIGKDDVTLILGDNIFYGHKLGGFLKNAIRTISQKGGAAVFGYYVNDPKRYGVIEFREDGSPRNITEKPKHPPSNYAVTGLYLYDNNVIQIAEGLTPSPRGELEITDINQTYLNDGRLTVKKMPRGYAWIDTGTHKSMLDAALFVKTIEERQGLKIACIEEIALRMGYITTAEALTLTKPLEKSGYGQYLHHIIETIDRETETE